MVAVSVANVIAWPVSFCIGVMVGLVLCSRGYKIVRTKDKEDA